MPPLNFLQIKYLRIMKKMLFIFIIVMNFSNIINAQNNYYYYLNGAKVYLERDNSKLNISTFDNFQKPSFSNLNFKNFTLSPENGTNQKLKFATLEFQSLPTEIEFLQKSNSLKMNPDVKNVCYYYRKSGFPSIGTSNFFYVKLKNIADFALLQQIAIQKNVQIVKQIPNMPVWYIISLNKTTIGDSLTLCNYFYETALFANVDPAFMFNFKSEMPTQAVTPTQNTTTTCVNDPFYLNQWGLASTYPYISINTCAAWDYSLGTGVKIAVVDGGINYLDTDLLGKVVASYDTRDDVSPTQYAGLHGTEVALVAAAASNNNYGIAGVAPQAQLMNIFWSSTLNDNSTQNPNVTAQTAAGIEWAWQHGAEVINNSWGNLVDNGVQSTVMNDAIDNALNLGRGGKGALVVFASGNYANNITYPASYTPRITTVGAIDSFGNRWDLAPSPDPNPPSNWQSSYGPNLDLVAPGVNVAIGPNYWNGQVYYRGSTSYAAPHVSGVIALILAANPCLTGNAVRQILESTASKVGYEGNYNTTPGRPNGTWYNELGYGLVNASAAVNRAISLGYPLDIYIKDNTADTGVLPNITASNMWNSPDIWIRNTDDGGTEHQNPIYSATSPNYMYINVRNKSCSTSAGTQTLKLYWAKAGTGLSWDYSWVGNNFPNNGPKLGDIIGTIAVPVIPPGGVVTIKIPWFIPDPTLYTSINPEPWHFCLLAKIIDTTEEEDIIYPYPPATTNLNLVVKHNNNIAWKNVTVVLPPAPNPLVSGDQSLSSVVAINNPFNEPHEFYLELIKEDLETGKAIYDESEVSLKMDHTLFSAWERGGKNSQLLQSTADEKKKIVEGNHVILDNIIFNPKEIGTLSLKFNFLTEELTNKSSFMYHIIQKDAVTNEIIGGETYIIKKDPRTAFRADAGSDKEVDKNEPIIISANQISEPAVYNWYDTTGNLVYTGKDLAISTDVATKFKLEVIATADGFKDYSEVEVNLKPSTLGNLTPNPATNNVNIAYKLNNVASGYLMILGGYGTTATSNNYILDTNAFQTSIDLSIYPSGFYTVALVCDGIIVDAKTLIKN